MRILIDLDGTIAHFDKKFQFLREDLFPHLTGIPITQSSHLSTCGTVELLRSKMPSARS